LHVSNSNVMSQRELYVIDYYVTRNRNDGGARLLRNYNQVHSNKY